ncbi:hypothetical protein N658DRAFT_496748 [Parathielavia hyrcaniae]|uniref:Uncharacterized protein n=1 Tax=Parathielavia hyrcaniae TaxID=113614 RepID=A0AAN6T1X2_9PEZI|nr:hypothetical protein N658DRAFT_496748 [Parathielavia hyrcaniae]
MPGSRPSSRHSSQASRPQTPQPRPPTPPMDKPGLVVPMGAVAFMDPEGNWEMITSVGGDRKFKGTAAAGKHNLFTDRMSSCFTVVIWGGSGAAYLSHVSAYLGFDATKRTELATMQAAFKTLWNKHHRELGTDFRVFVVDGEFTDDNNRELLLERIFGKNIASHQTKTKFKCEERPYPRTAKHGTGQVWTHPKQLYVEDVRKI